MKVEEIREDSQHHHHDHGLSAQHSMAAKRFYAQRNMYVDDYFNYFYLFSHGDIIFDVLDLWIAGRKKN